MTFSYLPFATDRDRVRFEIGDTDPSRALYQNEELDAMLVAAGTWQAATVMALEGIVARLSGAVAFTADWLKVDAAATLRAYEKLLARRQLEYGLTGAGTITVGAGHVYRADSDQDIEPYTE